MSKISLPGSSPTRPTHPARQAARARTAGALLVAALATGCASVGAPQQSQTLGDFAQLKVQADGTRSWRDAAASSYTVVHIDPSSIAFAKAVTLDPGQRQALREALAGALKQRLLADGIQLVDAPSSNAKASLRATVTGVEVASPALNALSTLLLFGPLSHGSLSAELEVVDTQTSQRIAALAFEGKAGLQNVGSAFSALGHAKLQIDLLATRFATLLSGKAPPVVVRAAAAPSSVWLP